VEPRTDDEIKAAAAVEQFWTLVDERKLEQAYQMLSAADRAAISGEQWLRGSSREPPGFRTPEFPRPAFLILRQRGPAIGVVARIGPAQGRRFEFPYQVVNESGAWRIRLGFGGDDP
jgi:hypothetical protein